jgi:hypothetical protein
MSSLPTAFPRFVPTLTEVVEPSSLTQPVNDGATSEQDLIESLTLHLNSVIERQVTEFAEVVIRTLVTEQLKIVKDNLKLELGETVKQLVHQVYSSNLDQYKQK